MAQLKDTIVSGNLRVTDTTLTDTLQVTTIKAPTSSSGSTYGPGSEGQVLKSNGSSVYWTSDSNTDEKVKVTANTTTKGYLIASTTSPNGTAVEGIADTGVYLGTTAGSLCATSFYENGTSLASKYAAIGHKHTTTIAANSGTNQLTLAASTKYKLTAGETNFIFTTPPNTTYSAGTGLSLSDTTFNHSNSVTAVTIYNKPYVRYDAQGHITGSSYWTATAVGTDGESGWIKVATMVHTGTHDNTPIMLLVSQRGTTITYKLHIVWKNTGNTDPDIDKFRLSSDIDTNADVYIKKSATSTWELYIKKLDTWEAIAMHLYVGKYFPDCMTWTWQDVQTAESAITGGIEASKIVSYNYYQSRTANTVLAAPNGSDGKATFRKLVAADLPYTNTGATNRPVYFSDGVPVQCDTPASGSWFKGVPLITTDGVMEFGRMIDFHSTDTSTADYDLRLQYIGTATGKTITLPGASGNVSLLAKGGTSYYGMLDGTGTTSGWIRTTTNGFLPVQSGNAGSGHSSLGTSSWYFSAAYIDNIHANTFEAGKASTIDGEMKFYNSGGSGVTTLKASAQSTSGTYLLPERGNLQYTLSCGHEDLSAATGSLSAANVVVPSYTKFIKIVFKSDSNPILYSMVEIPYFGNGDYGALVQVGTYGDGPNGSPRIVMKAVIINITDGTQTGKKSFTVTGSPTTKINGSNISNFERNITIHKIYATD